MRVSIHTYIYTYTYTYIFQIGARASSAPRGALAAACWLGKLGKS